MALLDSTFRATLPPDLTPDVQKFLQNPGCACNHKIYQKVLKFASHQLADFFPQLSLPTQEDLEKVSQNYWIVINCHINELEDKLRNLPPGRKQLDISRYQDQVTVVINELDVIF